jgi:hypothetical protein
MLPEGAKEAAQAALEAASAWTCGRCLARRQASKMKQPDCSTCTTVHFHRPYTSKTSRKSAHQENQF